MELLAAVAVFFLYPVLSMSGNSFRAGQILMRRELSAFVESVCSHGYLTREGYEDCLSQASNLLTNVRIEVQIRHTVFTVTGDTAPANESEKSEAGAITEAPRGVPGIREEEIPSAEIEAELWKNGIVKFQKGDYITVILAGKPSGPAGIPYLSGTDAVFRLESGGRIRDETESVCINLS